MSAAVEHWLELAAVRHALADAYARQGEADDARRHRAAARFYARCADEQAIAEQGGGAFPPAERWAA